MRFRLLLVPVIDASQTHLQLYNRLNARSPPPGQLVAELTFGFDDAPEQHTSKPMVTEQTAQDKWSSHTAATPRTATCAQRYNDNANPSQPRQIMSHLVSPTTLSGKGGADRSDRMDQPNVRDSILVFILDHFTDTYTKGRARNETDFANASACSASRSGVAPVP